MIARQGQSGFNHRQKSRADNLRIHRLACESLVSKLLLTRSADLLQPPPQHKELAVSVSERQIVSEAV